MNIDRFREPSLKEEKKYSAYVKAVETLELELGREPTESEINNLMEFLIWEPYEE